MKNGGMLLCWLACTMLFASCKRTATLNLEAVLKEAKFPIFCADSYSETVERVGSRKARGRIYYNVTKVDSIREIVEAGDYVPKYLILAEDVLVREMIESELKHQSRDPNRLKMPLFFLRNERFKLIETDNQMVKAVESMELQNIKVEIKTANATKALNKVEK